MLRTFTKNKTATFLIKVSSVDRPGELLARALTRSIFERAGFFEGKLNLAKGFSEQAGMLVAHVRC